MLVHPTGQFDNKPLPAQHIEVVPIAAALGAEVSGVSLADLSDEAVSEIHAALYRHKVLVFPNQDITHKDQEGFAGTFGQFSEDAYTEGVSGHPNVQPVIREADDSSNMIFGSGWHTDSPFLAEPPAVSMLRSIVVPPYGGDTVFANSALAYQLLSDPMKTLLQSLRVHMSMRKVLQSAHKDEVNDSPLGRLAATKHMTTLPDDLQRKVDGNFHPLVRTHPVTGEQSLYCDVTYSVDIAGLHGKEAQTLLNFLTTHITQPALTCRVRWSPNMLVVWDNRLCIHQAFNDYQGYRREMYRTTIAGDMPC